MDSMSGLLLLLVLPLGTVFASPLSFNYVLSDARLAGSSQFQAVVDAMRAADEDKLPNSEYRLNWGNKLPGKEGSNKLFVSVNETYFKRPVYAKLIKLYEQNVFTPEVCTAEPKTTGIRKAMFMDVLDAWTDTAVFKLAYKYLVDIGKADAKLSNFKDYLFKFWFGMYERCKGKVGSSGFEHVFSGEWKKKTVDGQHNWVRFYQIEKADNIRYEGYYHYDGQLTGTFKYTWAKEMKNMGGFLIGTSPAFDFSLLTMCAMTSYGEGSCQFSIDNYPLKVTIFTEDCVGGGKCLSTAYPEDM